MRVFIVVLVLIFSLQSWTKADDISEFQIEGMSIGDSLLDHFSKEEIKKNEKNYYKDKEYSISEIDLQNSIYNRVNFHYKTNDPKYIMYGVAGLIYYKKNIQDCDKKKEEIVTELSELFKDDAIKRDASRKHNGDPSGKSKISAITFDFKSDDFIDVSCYDWSKKMKYWDHLRITITTKELNHWLWNKAYK